MQRICVFCGASPGLGTAYLELAASVGVGLARRGIGLVYGTRPLGTAPRTLTIDATSGRPAYDRAHVPRIGSRTGVVDQHLQSSPEPG